MLVWEESYRIGVDEMDSEHLILFALLNQLDININNDMSAECVVDVLGALASYIDYHFAHEEALMKSVGFPGLEEHAAQHRVFVAEVARLRDLAGAGDALQAALKVRNFVLNWLLGHILETDAHYARHMASQ